MSIMCNTKYSNTNVCRTVSKRGIYSPLNIIIKKMKAVLGHNESPLIKHPRINREYENGHFKSSKMLFMMDVSVQQDTLVSH